MGGIMQKGILHCNAFDLCLYLCWVRCGSAVCKRGTFDCFVLFCFVMLCMWHPWVKWQPCLLSSGAGCQLVLVGMWCHLWLYIEHCMGIPADWRALTAKTFIGQFACCMCIADSFASLTIMLPESLKTCNRLLENEHNTTPGVQSASPPPLFCSVIVTPPKTHASLKPHWTVVTPATPPKAIIYIGDILFPYTVWLLGLLRAKTASTVKLAGTIKKMRMQSH